MSAGSPATRWGWHPLDDEWARRIVAASPVRPDDLVLDLGAGTGALTRPLLDAGARVIALELHPRRVADLRAIGHPRLTVVATDLRALYLPRRPFRVVSSLPFDGSSAIVRRLLAPRTSLLSADLVLQRQMAERFVRVTAGRRRPRLEIRCSVPRSAFRPPPGVPVVLLAVRP